jgi:WD40 repeat protein
MSQLPFSRFFVALIALSVVSLCTALAATIIPENINQVSELSRYGNQVLYDVALSPDGRLIAVATSLSVELLNASNLSNTKTIQIDTPISSIVFDLNSQMIAGRSKSNEIYLWRLPDGQLIKKIKLADKGRVSSLVFSKTGESLMFFSEDVLKSINIADGKLTTMSETKILGFDTFVVIPDAQMLAIAQGNSVMLLKLSGEVFRVLKGHTSQVSGLAVSPDGQRLASQSKDRTIIWSISDGKRLRTLKLPSTDSSIMSFSSDGRLLVTAIQKLGAVVWDVETGEQIASLREPNLQTRKVFISGDNKLLLTDSTSELRIWQSLGARQPNRLSLPKTVLPQRIAFSSDGEIVARSFVPGRAKIERASDGRQVADVSSDACCWTLTLLEDVLELVNVPVSISPQKRMVALSVSERRERGRSIVIIQDLKRGTRSEFPIADTIFSLAFSADEQLLAAGGDKVHLVNTRDRRIVQTLEHAKGVVISLAFSSDGQLLATASTDGIIRLWQVADGKLASELPKQEKPILSVAFSPDNALLATAGADRVVRLWRVADGKLAQTLKGHESIVGTVAFSADGALLASGALDGAINLWQVSDGKLLKTLKGHTDNVMGLAFMKDGRLASASSDGTTRLWGVK